MAWFSSDKVVLFHQLYSYASHSARHHLQQVPVPSNQSPWPDVTSRPSSVSSTMMAVHHILFITNASTDGEVLSSLLVYQYPTILVLHSNPTMCIPCLLPTIRVDCFYCTIWVFTFLWIRKKKIKSESVLIIFWTLTNMENMTCPNLKCSLLILKDRILAVKKNPQHNKLTVIPVSV